MPNFGKTHVKAMGLFVPAALLLVLQGSALHLLSFPERELPNPGLHNLPFTLGNWAAREELGLDKEQAEYLRPNEYIMRDYTSQADHADMNLFVAFFQSLQNSYGPHSPRICLPGSGWLVRSSKQDAIPVPGRAEAIPVNEYVMEKSGSSIFVIYWYQNGRDVWADEFNAKLRLLPDLLRYKRSDVTLVRLVEPMQDSNSRKEIANSRAFAALIFPLVQKRL